MMLFFGYAGETNIVISFHIVKNFMRSIIYFSYGNCNFYPPNGSKLATLEIINTLTQVEETDMAQDNPLYKNTSRPQVQ